ncbi:MAG: hypothetical protein JNJ61_30995 [Anaerolineae bacterium]|nr:hypothetical protein [Anaerolineae bacterium]
MSQAQAERAIRVMSGDTHVRSELTDDEAALLLRWGEAQVNALAGQNLDDAGFDQRCGQLTELLVTINRFVGQRMYITAEAQRAGLDEILLLARAAGYTVAAADVDAFAKEHGALANSDALTALTSLLRR